MFAVPYVWSIYDMIPLDMLASVEALPIWAGLGPYWGLLFRKLDYFPRSPTSSAVVTDCCLRKGSVVWARVLHCDLFCLLLLNLFPPTTGWCGRSRYPRQYWEQGVWIWSLAGIFVAWDHPRVLANSGPPVSGALCSNSRALNVAQRVLCLAGSRRFRWVALSASPCRSESPSLFMKEGLIPMPCMC